MFKFLVIVSTTVLSTVLSYPFNGCMGKCPESQNPFESPTLLPHGDCTKYCFCNDGCPTVRTCPENFHFSLDESMCLPVELAKCDDRSNCLGRCPIVCDTHNVLSLLPHSNSSKFCHCGKWGVPTVETCPESLVFNFTTGQCVKPNPDCHHGETEAPTVRSTGVVVPPTIRPILPVDLDGPVYFPKVWPTSTPANSVSEDGTTVSVNENDVTTIPPTIPPILPVDLDGPVYFPKIWPTSTPANSVSEDGTTVSVSENDVTTIRSTGGCDCHSTTQVVNNKGETTESAKEQTTVAGSTSTSANSVSEDGTTVSVNENDVTTIPPTIPPILPVDLDGPVYFPKIWPTSTPANSVSEDGTTASVNENDVTTIRSTGGCDCHSTTQVVNNKGETTESAKEQTTVAGSTSTSANSVSEDGTTVSVNENDVTTIPPTIPPILPVDLDGPVYFPKIWPTSTPANSVSEDGTTASVSENDVTTIRSTKGCNCHSTTQVVNNKGETTESVKEQTTVAGSTSTSANSVSEDGTTVSVNENDVTTVPPTIPPILPVDLDGPVYFPKIWPTSTPANSVSEDGTTASVNENDVTTIRSTGGCDCHSTTHMVNNKGETTGSAKEQTTVAGNDAVTNEPNIQNLTTIACNIHHAATTEAKIEGSLTVSSSQDNRVPDSKNLVGPKLVEPKIEVPCNCTQTVLVDNNPPITREKVHIDDYFSSNVEDCIGQCPLENDNYHTTHLPHLVCSQFCICDWGKPIVMRCPDNLHFNREIETCDYAVNANCLGIGALTNF